MSLPTLTFESDFKTSPRLFSQQDALNLDALLRTGPFDAVEWEIEDDQGIHRDYPDSALLPLLPLVHWDAVSALTATCLQWPSGPGPGNHLAVDSYPHSTRFWQISPTSSREPIEHLCQQLILFLEALPLRPVEPSTRPSTPPLALIYDQLVTDTDLCRATRALYANAHYAEAVEGAFKCLNNLVKRKSRLVDDDGEALMEKAFSEKNPVLALNRLKTSSDRNEQVGYMLLFRGAMRGIRNPRAHEHLLTDDPQPALELIILAQHLMRVARTAHSRRPRPPNL
jgi:uncharacterized protein (TIGR02391 family)